MCCDRSCPDPARARGPRAGAARAGQRAGASSCSAAGVARYAPWRRCVRARRCRRRPTTRFSSSTRSVTSCRGSTTAWPTSGPCRISRPCSPPRPIASTSSHARRERSPSASAARSRACARATPRRRSSYERATGRAGLFEHRCELIRALTRGVMAAARVVDPPHRRPGVSSRDPAGGAAATSRLLDRTSPAAR